MIRESEFGSQKPHFRGYAAELGFENSALIIREQTSGFTLPDAVSESRFQDALFRCSSLEF
jgi:hypothetical protein